MTEEIQPPPPSHSPHYECGSGIVSCFTLGLHLQRKLAAVFSLGLSWVLGPAWSELPREKSLRLQRRKALTE